MGKTFTIDEASLDLPLLMLATLRALDATEGSATIQELDEKVIEMEGSTDVEQSVLMPNGRYRKLNYNLAWARTALGHGGALENPARGVWAVTESGRAIDSIEAVRAIHDQWRAATRKQSPRRDRSRRGSAERSSTGADEPVDTEEWRANLLEVMQGMTPEAFERLCKRLLLAAGFTEVELTPNSRDGGIDGIGTLRVNLVSFKVCFQCKRWNSQQRVRVEHIRDFAGAAHGRAEKGLYVTTTDFTKEARDEAARGGTMAIDLIDGQRLCDLLKEYGLGVRTEIVIDQSYFDSV